MRLFPVASLVLIVIISATMTFAQQPPVFTYYRLVERNDSSASRPHVVALNDSGMVSVSGEARVESVMVPTAWRVQCGGGGVPDDQAAELPGCGSPESPGCAYVIDPGDPEGLHVGCPEGYAAGRRGLTARPVVWYDSTANDSMDYRCTLLPIIGGDGTGEVRGCGFTSGPADTVWHCAGWSAPSGGVKHAVAWTADSIQGAYTLEVMGDYGPSYPSRANDVIADSDTTRLAVGWAVTAGGLTIPQRWWRDQQGTWTRAAMPLPEGAVEGGVNSLTDIFDVAIAAGWVKDGFGVKHAALWTKYDDMGPWVAEDLGSLSGFDESNGLASAPIGRQGNDIYVAGTSYTGGDSVATLWARDSTGTVTAHNLNDLIVNHDSLDLDLIIATGIVFEGGDTEIYVTGWGVEMGGMSLLMSPADPHAFLLIEETAGASVRKPHTGAVSMNLSASPNPFSSGVRASYALGRAAPVRLIVYDVQGRLVRVLTDGLQAAGDHAATWDGLDSHGWRAGSGIYFLRLEVGDQAVTHKAVSLR